ncbi:putative solute carrier family 6 [Trypoxylus dichotomus]
MSEKGTSAGFWSDSDRGSKGSGNAGFTQYTIWTIFFCLPFIYMQFLLGQYTQLGTILFKYLSPIGHGVAYVLISNLFLKTLRNSLLLNDSVVYFMSSFRRELQWTNCSPVYKIPCWDHNKKCKNCINSTYYMPGYIYFFFHYLEEPEIDPVNMSFSVPTLRKSIAHLVCWVFTSIVLMLATSNYVRAIKVIWQICIILLFLLILGCAVPDGKNSFLDLFVIGADSMTDVSTWSHTLNKAVTLFGLGRAFHFVHGSLIAHNSSVGLLSITVVTIHFVLTCAGSILAIASVNKIAYNTNTDRDHLTDISWATSLNTYFYVLPQGLGFMGIPQLWSIVYFGICILVNLNQQITHFIMIEKSLTDIYPNLLRYRKYVLSFFCLFSCMVSYLFLSRESFLIYKAVCYRMSDSNEMFNVVIMCILVCWIYGVQRFCDDIHFLTGKRTTKFWKICWYILPVIAMAAHGENVMMQLQSTTNDKIRRMDLLLYLLFLSPVPIMAAFQGFRFMRKRNLFGLLQPQERFGPPDRFERHLRRLFNPRKEVRSKRRAHICQHPCLIQTQELKTIIEEEVVNRGELLSKLTEDYESDESEY